VKKVLFRLEHIYVNRSAQVNLEDLSIDLFAGEILGILTQNSSEMDLLTDLLSGRHQPDEGRVLFCDAPLKETKGIGRRPVMIMIDKQNQLIESLTLADNLFVIRKGFRRFLIPNRMILNQTRMIFRQHHLDLAPDQLAYSLNRLERVLFKILKTHVLKIPVLLLKNPSSFLSDEEIKGLYPVLQDFRCKGLSIIVMDSLSSIMEACADRVMLLHNGQTKWCFRKGEFTGSALNRIFQLERQPRDRITPPAEPAEPSLIRFSSLETSRMAPLSLFLTPRSLHGILDVEGSQIGELKRLLLGEAQAAKGWMEVQGKQLKHFNPQILLSNRIGIIPEDPVHSQFFHEMSVIDNLAFSMGEKVPLFWQLRKFRQNIAKQYATYFEAEDLNVPLRKLSSRDRQTLVYMKWHLFAPRLLILIKPFSSVNRQLEQHTVNLLRLLHERGISLLILTSNEWELSALARILPLTIQIIAPLA
jgi:ribose transport system ATP-binding protein